MGPSVSTQHIVNPHQEESRMGFVHMSLHRGILLYTYYGSWCPCRHACCRMGLLTFPLDNLGLPVYRSLLLAVFHSDRTCLSTRPNLFPGHSLRLGVMRSFSSGEGCPGCILGNIRSPVYCRSDQDLTRLTFGIRATTTSQIRP